MPTYEYRCTECDHAFEAVQAFTDDSIEVCPSCGGRVRKLFGNVGIVFKGSGFYKTDSRDKKSAVSSASESTSSNGSDTESKSSGDKVSADSKPSGGSEGSSSKSDSGGSSSKSDPGSATPSAKPAAASTASSDT